MFKQDAQELVAALLRQAGITRTVQSLQATTNTGITNQMGIVARIWGGQKVHIRGSSGDSGAGEESVS